MTSSEYELQAIRKELENITELLRQVVDSKPKPNANLNRPKPPPPPPPPRPEGKQP